MKKYRMALLATVAGISMMISGAVLANDSRWGSGTLLCPAGGAYVLTILNTDGEETAGFDKLRCRVDGILDSNNSLNNRDVDPNETVVVSGDCGSLTVSCKVRAEELSDNLRFILHTFKGVVSGDNLIAITEGHVNEL